ncbi:cytochrome-c peroxidase [Phocoenobacter skyensis]|uniref:Cytochrome c peroxidase n=1 Tax=Phocoenobacter skyensis TaxID=97481 RepID=A0A1H8A6H7_9PAST|nr:cytochrome c peroxidase [Pasteurella skyensis]MDP8080396.1 cytochrome c peroxidase [Pasteurella skyensis]MDP8086386.1 cytochrome c peroxidase [Pasteurella skyensis]MDP8186143.1 cytochrome c peroxidase [Pasteurella skyensis]SEM66310.1 Cytochrome c peroxidase [Pasteurella skyensis]
MKKSIKNNPSLRNTKYMFFTTLAFMSIALHSTYATADEKQIAIKKDKAALEKIILGKMLYFDKALSQNGTLSCAVCHSPTQGFVDERPDNGRVVALGDDGHSRGDRNVPTASYAAFSPPFHFDEKQQEWVGGQFLDGRADTLAEQAGGPPLNPVEMNMPNKKAVIDRLKKNAFYQKMFKKSYGDDIFENNEQAYTAMTDAIEAFEKSKEFSPFDSKYDRYLKDEYELTVLEDLGMTLFFSNDNVSCANCHKLFPEGAKKETFTNFQYRNIGVPKNLELIALNKLGEDYIDKGLAGNEKIKDQPNLKALKGRFKTPTLRNVAVTAPYMHNGVFKHLRTVVEFYDTFNNPKRIINPETGKPWGETEVPETIDREDLAAKKLTDRKVDALVAFMKMLTDKRYEPLLEKLDKEEALFWKNINHNDKKETKAN